MNVFRLCKTTEAGPRSLTERKAQLFFARGFLHVFFVRGFLTFVSHVPQCFHSHSLYKKCSVALCRFTFPFVHCWFVFHLDDCPLLTEEEENDGDMNNCWTREVVWIGTH